LSNRLVRSATWDPSIFAGRKMTDEVLNLYRELAAGGVALIITGGLPVYRERLPGEETGRSAFTYADLHIEGIDRLADVAHAVQAGLQIVAQLETGYMGAGPSESSSPFSRDDRPLGVDEIRLIAHCFIERLRDAAGFDGVQLHAAHGDC
jgi:2,4-dienoyl-CoA reductase-like NADH-dependent reductase (Old Yellow Enzyme family)